MNKNIFAKRLLCFLLVGVLLAILPANYVYAKNKNYEFTVNLSAGYNQKILVGYGAPVSINVENNNTSNFEGFIQLIVPNTGNNNILYEEEIALGANEKKTVQMVVGIPVPMEFVNVRMTDKKHRVVWEELQKVVVSRNKNDIRIGVLSDDFTALSYMDRVHFLSDDTKSTSLIELSAADFPTDYYSLQMLDVILISDFSTDLLTKEQLRALSLWLSKGGFLIIGTGSTANKTLSGLKGNILNENVTSTVTRRTTLGLEDEDYAYLSAIYAYNSNNNYNVDDDFYDSYYYYNFYDYTDSSYYADYDKDGLNDYIYGYGGHFDEDGNFYDAYNNEIDPSNVYLFEDSAFYTDPDGSYHYKYYDERYGYVSETLEEVLDQYYGYDEEELFDVAFTEYCNLLGFDPKWYIAEQEPSLSDEDELDDYFEAYFGDDYREFLRHYAYLYLNYIYTGYDMRPDLKAAGGVLISDSYNKLDVDCAGLDETLSSQYDELLYADDDLTTDFPIAKIINSGEGAIALCAFDFTKNPIPKNAYSGEFVRNLIERYKGAELIQEADEYEKSATSSYFYTNSPKYNEKQLVKAAGSAPVPPVLIYALAILLYLIAILVLYLVMLKKKKTWNLWVIYPCLAVGVAVVIFCFGFSSRVLRLNINVITLMFPGEFMTNEVDYVNAVVPKSKEYTIDFSDEVEVDPNYTLESGSFYASDIDYSTYTVRYKTEYNHFQSILTNKVALESQPYKAEAAYVTQGGLEVSLLSDYTIGGKDANNIRVTNNYSTALEDVIVQVYTDTEGFKDYYFKEIKAGDSVVANTGDFIDDSQKPSYYSGYYYSSKYYNNVTKHYKSHKSVDVVLGFALGNLYRGFDKTMKRASVVEYCEDEYSPDSDHVFVLAFPKSDIGSEVIQTKKCRLSRTEAIIIFKDYTELPVKHQ